MDECVALDVVVSGRLWCMSESLECQLHQPKQLQQFMQKSRKKFSYKNMKQRLAFKLKEKQLRMETYKQELLSQLQSKTGKYLYMSILFCSRDFTSIFYTYWNCILNLRFFWCQYPIGKLLIYKLKVYWLCKDDNVWLLERLWNIRVSPVLFSVVRFDN